MARERGFATVRDGEAVPSGLEGAIVAIGNFDGVHRGHKALIAAARAIAAPRNAPVAVATFDPHPRAFFKPGSPLFTLTPTPTKLALLDRLGLHGAFVMRFDARFAALTARSFVADLLQRDLRAAGVVVGHDFGFGRGREGTTGMLEALGAELGLAVAVVPAVMEGGRPISSTGIRSALEAGDVQAANGQLGHRWFVAGPVRHGAKLGRTLGYPTANLRLGEDCRLRHGIYAVRLALDGVVRNGVASFGRRPTFDNGAPLLETHVFDFAGDLYDRTVEVEFVAWLRGEERFAGAEALIAQMDRDSQDARAALARGAGPSLIEAPGDPVEAGTA